MESDLKTANKKFNFLFFKTLLFLMFYVSACIISEPFLYLTLFNLLFYLCLFFGNAVCFQSSIFPLVNFGELFTFTSCASSVSSLLMFSVKIATVRWGRLFQHVLVLRGRHFLHSVFFLIRSFLSRSKQQESAPMNYA